MEKSTLKKIFGKEYIKVKLSVLWIFVMFNYIYADIITLMDPSILSEIITGTVNGIQMTQGLLFAAAILMEIPIAMIILSIALKPKASKWTNISAGTIKTLAIIATLFAATPTLYYLFFASIEIAFTSAIVIIAWKWKV